MMKKKEVRLNLNIVGPTGTGKAAVVNQIEKLLRSEGFIIERHFGYESEILSAVKNIVKKGK